MLTAWGAARFGCRQPWASPSMGIAKFGRRQVWASPILEAQPVILKVCFGSDGDTLRYPRVGKTVEGSSQQEATVRTRRPRALVPQNSNKGKEKGGFKVISPVPVGSNLTREVPTPPLENAWNRYDPGDRKSVV